MTDEAEAAEILMLAYRRLELEEQEGQNVSACTVKYTTVYKENERICFWDVRDSTLEVEIKDRDMDAGVKQAISALSRQSMGSDPRRFVNLPFVPYVMFGLLGALVPVFCLSLLILGYGVIGALLGVVAMIVAPILVVWGNRLTRRADEVFLERLIEATSLDEEHVRDLYSDYLRKTSWVRELVVIELVFLSFALYALMFAGFF